MSKSRTHVIGRSGWRRTLGAAVVSVQMTKAQSSTLGDVFKALAL